ncbi:MAG: tRNA 2-thiouridine(34) synthase MnmA [Patescibacteria group bacterium]
MAKVYVGMSGGVDSSVSAALLKDGGHDVTGVFIKTWHPEFLTCTWREDRADAMAVCAKLNIPFETLDLEEAYKRDVADYMIEEYKHGRTPNPDVMCNRFIKFGGFFEYARAHGAEYVATGHYARVETDEDGNTSLLTGIDTNKDQSYFLWAVPQEKLQHVLFPIGEYKKSEVREIAKRFDLPVADKKDSQGVCFLGKLEMRDFLKRYIEEKQGDVLSVSGEVIGHHEGAFFYTRGQRHGFTITKKTPNDTPYYVVDKNIDTNTITVSQDVLGENEHAYIGAVLENTAWTNGMPEEEKEYTCRFRYRQPRLPCRIQETEEGYAVTFTEPVASLNSGQSIVLYDGETCLGGGVIQKTTKG